MDAEAVGKRIREARKTRAMTQEALAEMTGLTPGHIGVIERGAKVPQVDSLVAICNALHVSADEILQDVVDVSAGYTANEVYKQLCVLPMPEQRKILRALEILTEK